MAKNDMKLFLKYNCAYYLEYQNKDYLITDINNFPFKNIPATKRLDVIEVLIHNIFHKNI